MSKKLDVLLFASLFFLFMSHSTFAHHPEIVAEAVCDESVGGIVINYTATAWESADPVSRENSQIDILFDEAVVDSGSFSAPDYSFSNSIPAPEGASTGDTVVVTAVAVADWGNGGAGGEHRSTLVTIPENDCETFAEGRFTGGGHQIRVDGVRVTRGLTLHCDLLLSNNLEINWQGNQFHMEEQLITVACTDDPDIIQAPPPAPLDTFVGVGIGRFNNVDGYTIEFTLVDAGEPGVEDKAAFQVYETSNPGNVILDIPLQLITGGNLQAHYDQPHK